MSNQTIGKFHFSSGNEGMLLCFNNFNPNPLVCSKLDEGRIKFKGYLLACLVAEKSNYRNSALSIRSLLDEQLTLILVYDEDELHLFKIRGPGAIYPTWYNRARCQSVVITDTVSNSSSSHLMFLQFVPPTHRHGTAQVDALNIEVSPIPVGESDYATAEFGGRSGKVHGGRAISNHEFSLLTLFRKLVSHHQYCPKAASKSCPATKGTNPVAQATATFRTTGPNGVTGRMKAYSSDYDNADQKNGTEAPRNITCVFNKLFYHGFRPLNAYIELREAGNQAQLFGCRIAKWLLEPLARHKRQIALLQWRAV